MLLTLFLGYWKLFVKDQKEIQALIHLLDDPDEIIYQQIRQKIIGYGEDLIPELEDVWENSTLGILFQNRIEEIIHEIQFKSSTDSLKLWKESPEQDLLEGMILIARYQYPDLNEAKVRKQIDKIKQDVWIELNPNLTALEKVKVINQTFFDLYGFSGNTTNYHAPQNSYINDVLDTKKGNPISLSILYMIIGQFLDVPLYGINLPRHFILGYADDFFLNEEDIDKGHILFYINPFSKGGVFSHQEIDYFLKQLNLTHAEEFYLPCSNLTIITRVLNNLIYSYEKLGYMDKIEELKTLKDILS